MNVYRAIIVFAGYQDPVSAIRAQLIALNLNKQEGFSV